MITGIKPTEFNYCIGFIEETDNYYVLFLLQTVIPVKLLKTYYSLNQTERWE